MSSTERRGPDLVIRAARDDDARQIAEIHGQAWQWAYRDLLPKAFLASLSVERRAAYWQRWLADADLRRQLWLGLRQERVVGFVAAGPSRDPDADAETGEILALYLEQEVVGIGVGRALCAHAVDRLRRDGFRVATLWVLVSNDRARRFYERTGWRADGTQKTEEWSGVALRDERYRRELID
jgi:ribosomal protein S18 acetylase RimI-like enzyme